MMWDVSEAGKIIVKLHAEGDAVQQMSREAADTYIANIVGDLATSQGVEVVTDELRYSFSKTRAEITVTWRASADPASVTEIREYFARLSRSHDPVVGEVEGVVDEPPD
jgi:hypothetical protein